MLIQAAKFCHNRVVLHSRKNELEFITVYGTMVFYSSVTKSDQISSEHLRRISNFIFCLPQESLVNSNLSSNLPD